MTDPTPLYSGEAILLNWHDAKSGRKIVLRLEKDKPGAHPFDGLDGERFAVVIMGPLASTDHGQSIGNDDKPMTKVVTDAGAVIVGGDNSSTYTPAPRPTKPKRHWRDMPPSQRAALMNGDPEFWRYLGTCGVAEPTTALAADASLKFLCNIQSKRELDEREKAAETFDRLCGNFGAWKQAKGHGQL